MWVNSGAASASTLAVVNKVRAEVPHFMEVNGDQPEFIELHGYPADIVPQDATWLGRAVRPDVGPKFVSRVECCSANLWQPMAKAIKEVGAKYVYRGQKDCDSRRAPIKNGDVIDGVTYYFPIYDWTDRDVIEFLGDELPENYRKGEKASSDCWNCTAYLDENVERIQNLPSHERMIVQGRLAMLLKEVDHSRSELLKAIGQTRSGD
jgi:phosphoadenosine phosphosulfate reductase